MKRAATISVLVLATAVIWIASSPTTLHAFAIPRGVASSSVSALAAPTTAAKSQAVAAPAARAPITAPLALLLQGVVFLACGFLLPKKPGNSPARKRAPTAIQDSTVRGIETVNADRAVFSHSDPA